VWIFSPFSPLYHLHLLYVASNCFSFRLKGLTLQWKHRARNIVPLTLGLHVCSNVLSPLPSAFFPPGNLLDCPLFPTSLPETSNPSPTLCDVLTPFLFSCSFLGLSASHHFSGFGGEMFWHFFWTIPSPPILPRKINIPGTMFFLISALAGS